VKTRCKASWVTASHRGWRQAVGQATADGLSPAGRHQLSLVLARAASCSVPTSCRAVFLGPWRNVSSPLFVLLCTLLCETC